MFFYILWFVYSQTLFILHISQMKCKEKLLIDMILAHWNMKMQIFDNYFSYECWKNMQLFFQINNN